MSMVYDGTLREEARRHEYEFEEEEGQCMLTYENGTEAYERLERL